MDRADASCMRSAHDTFGTCEVQRKRLGIAVLLQGCCIVARQQKGMSAQQCTRQKLRACVTLSLIGCSSSTALTRPVADRSPRVSSCVNDGACDMANRRLRLQAGSFFNHSRCQSPMALARQHTDKLQCPSDVPDSSGRSHHQLNDLPALHPWAHSLGKRSDPLAPAL